jgi:hypothetical protein
MPQFTIPDSHSHDTFLSPRKSFIVVGLVSALSAVALFAGRTRFPTLAVGSDSAQLPANPDLDSRAPPQRR